MKSKLHLSISHYCDLYPCEMASRTRKNKGRDLILTNNFLHLCLKRV